MICALAMADAIEAVADLPVRVKWPNDLLINGRKVGGILTELGLHDNQVGFAVVGIGLNVNVDFDAATSCVCARRGSGYLTGLRFFTGGDRHQPESGVGTRCLTPAIAAAVPDQR